MTYFKQVKKLFLFCLLQAQDLAFFQYTGGTTGIAKGAELLTVIWWPMYIKRPHG